MRTKQMSTIVQPSPEWIERVQAFFTAEGLRQTTREEYDAIPEDLRAGIPLMEDRDAPFGTRPPTPREIAEFYDRLAPHHDALTMTQYNLEVQATAWLMEEMNRHPVYRIVDAGCGTGITLALLARFKKSPENRLCGYDCSYIMVECAASRVSLHRAGDEHVAAWRGTHRDTTGKFLLPPSSIDLLFTKCSFSAGTFAIPFFDEAPSPQMAREDFYANDPTMAQWRKNLEAFARVLRPGGRYIHIGVLADGPIEALVWLAEDTGFRLVTEDPVWFEQRPTPTEEFCTEFAREMTEVGIPAEHHPEAIHRHWNWDAMATGALIFIRK